MYYLYLKLFICQFFDKHLLYYNSMVTKACLLYAHEIIALHLLSKSHLFPAADKGEYLKYYSIRKGDL